MWLHISDIKKKNNVSSIARDSRAQLSIRLCGYCGDPNMHVTLGPGLGRATTARRQPTIHKPGIATLALALERAHIYVIRVDVDSFMVHTYIRFITAPLLPSQHSLVR